MPTLRDYRAATLEKLGGFQRCTATLPPDVTDPLAQRSIYSADLYEFGRDSKAFSGAYAWNGRYRDQRRVRIDGYSALPYIFFMPPASGTYVFTFFGYGVSGSIAFNANAADLQSAIASVGPGLASTEVDGDTVTGFTIRIPSQIDATVSSGTITGQGGVGRLEVTRGFTAPLSVGDEVDLSMKIPFKDADGVQGIHTLINTALRRMYFIDRFPITPASNSLGSQTIFTNSAFPWLTSKKQVIALYDPTETQLVAAFSPPGSGTYTLTLHLHQNYTTAPLNFDASAVTIQAAIEAALGTSIHNVTVSGVGPFTLTLPRTWYAVPRFSASAGTIVNSRQMLYEPPMAPRNWLFSYDAELPYLAFPYGEQTYSYYVEGYRPAHTWINAQVSHGVLGDTWLDSTVGLVNDYDQAQPDVDELAIVAAWMAAQQLGQLGPPSDIKFWQGKAQEWGEAAAHIKLYDWDVDEQPRSTTKGGRIGTFRGVPWF